MRKAPFVILTTFSPFVASTAYTQPLPPAPQVCIPASQAQALVAFLALAPALQAQIIEAAQAKDREADIVKRAKAEQKAEDEAAKAVKP
jgi:hypothetical protein